MKPFHCGRISSHELAVASILLLIYYDFFTVFIICNLSFYKITLLPTTLKGRALFTHLHISLKIFPT